MGFINIVIKVSRIKNVKLSISSEKKMNSFYCCIFYVCMSEVRKQGTPWTSHQLTCNIQFYNMKS